MNLPEILEVYFTQRERLTAYLTEMDKEVLVRSFADVLHRYATDVNSSTLREMFTLIKAGYQPTPGKLGYNGMVPSGRPCDVKPINIRSESGNKLNGSGNFSDFTYERLSKFLADGVIMLVSGFVDGRLVYILEFPFAAIHEELKRQLDRFFTTPRKPNQYLRSASFSFKHYKNSPFLKVVYEMPNLKDFKQFLTRDLYAFLQR